jgi:hypothetical protein
MAIVINIESQVSQTITDGVTNKAPSENAVFDALALKIGGAVSIGQVAFGTDTNVISGDSGFTWDNTNKRLGVGTSTPTARLHVQSQGALSTDIGFRVRNSANTADLLNVSGNGAITGSRINLYTDGASQPRAELGASNVVSSYGTSSILGNSNTINLQSGGRANVIGSSNTVSGGSLSVNVIGSGNSGAGSGLVMIGSNNSNHIEKENTVIIGSRIKMPTAGARPYQIKIGTGGNVSTSDIQGSFQLYLNNTDNSDLFLSNKTNLVLSNQTFIAGGTHFEVNATNTVTTHNGVAPTTNILDAFQLYSANRGGTAGKASAHFRAEDGTINVIGDFSGFGTDSPQARLDVRAQGALSTDVAFRVRNSANTIDRLSLTGTAFSITSVNRAEMSVSANAINFGLENHVTNIIHASPATTSYTQTASSVNRSFIVTNLGDGINTEALNKGCTIFGSTIRLGTFGNVQNKMHFVCDQTKWGLDGVYSAGFQWFRGNQSGDGGFNTATLPSITTANRQMWLTPENSLLFFNTPGITFTTNTDSFQQYSADIVAGNAAPHFRTENGSVIKLYKQDLPTNPTNAELATFLSNLGLANLI